MPTALEDFVIYSLVGLVSVLVTRMLSRRSEKIKETMAQFRYYHSPEMLEARSVAWKFLCNVYPKNPVPFDHLFGDKVEDTRNYEGLSRVIYFWMSLYSLNQEKAISRKLAKELFLTQYLDWEKALEPLYERSRDGSDYRPDWFIFYEADRMAWLKS